MRPLCRSVVAVATVWLAALAADAGAAGLPRGAQVRAWKGLDRNIGAKGSHPGAVVAAPGGNVEYQFHWTRDGAVAMNEVVHVIDRLPRGAARDAQLARAKAFVRFSWRTMKVSSQTGLGEPKFTLRGGAFDGLWGRPQNDGPALRALTSIKLARTLGRAGEQRYVRRALLGDRKRGLIHADLDYLVDHWREPSFDLWEEVKGDHFYTRLVQRAALAQGGDLARELGDVEAADRYQAAAGAIDEALDAHWDGKILRASLGGARSGLDAAVILGVLHAAPTGKHGVLDERVLATAHAVERSFRTEYPLNRGIRRATLFGRYPEDRYTGQPFKDKDHGGNPWVLTTTGFAEYHYRVAAELGRSGPLRITRTNRPFFVDALGKTALALPVGAKLAPGSPELAKLQHALVRKGDAILARVERKLGPGGVTREQLHRSTGSLVGAEELTWNHASFLSAARAREDAVGASR